MKAIKFLTIALALTAMQTVQAADNLNGKNNGTNNIDPNPQQQYVTVGDVNEDGKVDNSDVILLARAAGKWSGADENIKYWDAADINRDGDVNNSDVILLARAAAKWSGYDKYLIQVAKVAY